ncbi:MAG TPA: HNH/ENDO VII family nuclease, partial [Prosthecobacter sp.]|nr:HNH/ENDO VII family nuclease [Prosthecobacter sp.]
DYQARVAWTRPPEGQPFTGLDLLTGTSGSRLAVDANGRPYVVIRVSSGRSGYIDTRYDLPASATQVAPGASSTVEFSCQASGLLLGLAWQGESQLFVRSSVVSGKLDVVPVASRPWVTEVVYARTAYSTQVPGGAPVSGVSFTGLDAGGFTTTSGGTVSFTVAVPTDFPYPVLEIRTVGSGSPVLHIPVSAAPPPPGTPPPPPPPGQVSAALSAQLQGIALDVVYDNRAATAQEQAEIARHAAKKAASAPEKAVPPAFGGGLAHQSSAGLNFLAAAQQLNGIVTEIQEQAARMNTVNVTDATGAQLYQYSVGVGVSDLLRHFGLSSGLQQAHDFYQPLTEALKQAHADALTALVRSLQGTASWTHMQITSRQLGGHPLMGSVDKIATQLTDEGLMDYVKAMARYAYQFQQTPDAAALVTFAHLDGILKVPLNQWAQNGGATKKTVVAAAGFVVYSLQAAAMVSSAAVDQGAAKRLAGQMTGTIISAWLGSQQAQDDLEQMVPVWNWLIQSEGAGDFIESGDYYGAGKQAAEDLVTVIGDLTIVFPVVKGAALAIKASGGVINVTVVQGLRKTAATVFERDGFTQAGAVVLDDLTAGSQFWKTSEFQGKRVYQRDDLIDPHLRDVRGRTNLERMKIGYAPKGPDGNSINLHHTIQSDAGPLAELTETFHRENSKIIHINPNTIPSGINREAFDLFRRDYWKNRAKDFEP